VENYRKKKLNCLYSIHLIVSGGPQLALKDEYKPYSPERHSFVLEKERVISIAQLIMGIFYTDTFHKEIRESLDPWKVGKVDNFLRPKINR
jgi:hypothetical protein